MNKTERLYSELAHIYATFKRVYCVDRPCGECPFQGYTHCARHTIYELSGNYAGRVEKMNARKWKKRLPDLLD
jgi:hypothetical protein